MQPVNLKECRERLGLTQRKIAELIGVTERQVINWESGRSTPQGHRRVKLAEAYGVPLEQIPGGTANDTAVPAA